MLNGEEKKSNKKNKEKQGFLCTCILFRKGNQIEKAGWSLSLSNVITHNTKADLHQIKARIGINYLHFVCSKDQISKQTKPQGKFLLFFK
jgi:hypothetical protein